MGTYINPTGTLNATNGEDAITFTAPPNQVVAAIDALDGNDSLLVNIDSPYRLMFDVTDVFNSGTFQATVRFDPYDVPIVVWNVENVDLRGTTSDDTFNLKLGSDISALSVKMDGGAGQDSLTFDWSKLTTGISFVVSGSTIASTFGTFSNFEVFELRAGSGNDTITTGSGNDNVYTGTGIDNVSTGAGNDYIFSESNGGTIDCGDGLDFFSGGVTTSDPLNISISGTTIDFSGRLVVTNVEGFAVGGGSGDDVFNISTPNGGTVYGGEGTDILNYNYVPTSSLQLTIEAHEEKLYGSLGPINNQLTFNDFEGVSVNGSQFNDYIRIWGSYSGSGLSLNAGAGADFLELDFAYSQTGFTFIVAADGTVTSSLGSIVGFETFELNGGFGADTLYGGAGDDRITGGRGADQINGGAGNDVLSAVDESLPHQDDGAVDVIAGGSGNDTIFAGLGDVIDGGSGIDTLNLDLRAATSGITASFSLVTSGGSITIAGGTIKGIETLGIITGSNFDDYITAGSSSGVGVQLSGEDGNDRLVGSAAGDTIYGGNGNDVITGGLGQDTLADGDGDDVFKDTAAGLNGDTINGFSIGDKIIITDANFSNFTFNLSGNILTYSGGTLSFGAWPLPAQMVASAVAGGGVQLELKLPPVATYDQLANQLTSGYWDGDVHHWNVTQGGAITVNISMLSADEQAVARAALASWGEIIGVQFVEVTSGAQIAFDNTYVPGEGAYTESSWSNGIMTSAVVHIPAGWTSTYGSYPGSYGFETYLHEVGHALGLGHAGNYNQFATYAEDALFANDSLATSIMSYFDQGESLYFGLQNFSNYNPATPMLADIVAMQTLYGLSTTTRTGNTIYGFNSNAGAVYNASGSVALTIFDSGGNDTLDYSNVYYPQLLNLNPETFSNVNAGVGNLAIARGTIIENAIGGMGADTIIGNAVANVLTGGSGNDKVTGGAGNDTFRDSASGLNGDTITDFGYGDRILIVDATLTGFTFNLTGNVLTYTGGSLTLTAPVNGTITAAAAALGGVQLTIQPTISDDILTSGPNVDNLDGAEGSDVYLIPAAGNHASAEIHDTGMIGTDEVRFSATGTPQTLKLYAGDTGIERVVIGTGTGANAVITGLTANNVDARAVLNGLEITGNSGANTLYATAFADTLSGGNGIDRLYGYGGSDLLDGGREADVMYGGAGDDTYVVDHLSDAPIELAGEGTDLVLASVAHTLKANVENLTLTGIYSITGRGNALDNLITGNSGSNRLWGESGNDTLIGNAGSDQLDGGSGDDTLSGGAGNDLYFIDSAGDTVTELDGEGIDRVETMIGCTLGANVENLTLAGTGAIDGTGNALANTLKGNGGANLLSGLGGNDKVYAGAGNDVVDGGTGNDWLEGGSGLDQVTGGSGSDRFVFRTGDFGGSTTVTADIIHDFSHAEADKIRLDLVDANTTLAGTQDFAFLGAGSFTGIAGQLRYEQINGNTYVSGDTNGDGIADFMIRLDGLHTLVSGDFIL